ncbi:unnamed protein product [Mytilus coruscus]|uniref:Uncharacterized protein n=1 Tax=Mytilus coruscus TaxID=42192 RepID=A0A6J8BHB2_MYTCO|nr:unnamed protein product [Mytilus coruscus]
MDKTNRKSQSTQISTSSTKDCDINGNKNSNSNLQDQNTACKFESQYDEIDESFSTLRVTKPSTNIAIIDESVSLPYKNRTEQPTVSSEYLTPISDNDESRDLCDNQDTELTSEVEIPECCGRPQSAVSDYLIPVNAYKDSTVTSRDSPRNSNSQGDDYLHPYTSFMNNLHRDTVTADIHRDDQVSSESDEEVNNHKYSHLYEQLRHDLKDICPTYMLPSCPFSTGYIIRNDRQHP